MANRKMVIYISPIRSLKKFVIIEVIMNAQVMKKLDDFFHQYKHQKYKRGEILIRADENPSGIFYLEEGIVKRYTISSQGGEIILNLYKKHSFFPMSWAINKISPSHYFEAMTPVETWKAPPADVVNFLITEHDVCHELLSRAYTGMERVWIQIEYLLSGNAYARIIVEIIHCAEKFGKAKGNKILITYPIKEKDLAAQTGMARETVSRSIQELRKKKLVTFEKNVLIITNLEKLRQELSLQ